MYALIVSLPLRNLTYSAWMSGEPKAAMGGNRRQSIATAPTVAARCRPLPPLFSAPIGHPPDFAALVVTHEQRAVRQNQETDGPAPPISVRTLPPHDEIFHAGRVASAAIHLHAHHLGAGRHAAIPRAVQRHEGVTAILLRKLPAGIEREPERRRMRLYRDRGRLDVRAVG